MNNEQKITFVEYQEYMGVPHSEGGVKSKKFARFLCLRNKKVLTLKSKH